VPESRSPSPEGREPPPWSSPAKPRRRLRSCAQVAILDRQCERLPVRARRMAFWERPTPALADRGGDSRSGSSDECRKFTQRPTTVVARQLPRDRRRDVSCPVLGTCLLPAWQHDPGQHHGDEQQGRVINSAGCQPFIWLMSSTAMEPRLR
jgi:hypothetical protein